MRMPPRPRTGATLIETVTVLTLAAVALGVALPSAGAVRDRQALRAASASLAALVARARAEAPARGGTRIELDATADRVALFDGDELLDEVRLGGEHGVALELGGGRTHADVAFDVLGLGRIASRTIVLGRGARRDTLTISSYGRLGR